MTTKRVTLKELREMKERGEIQPPKGPKFGDENLHDGFWDNAEIVMPDVADD